MLYIPASKFYKLAREHPDYITRCVNDHTHKGHQCKRGDWMGFESTLTGDVSKGTSLIFEHIHFEIVKGA